MKSLGYSKFSLLGWCDGGTVALLLAATYPDSIRKMIVLGARSYVRSKEIQVFENTYLTNFKKYFCQGLRDINTWSERLITDLLQVYNMDYIQKIVSEWIEYMLRVYIKQDGDLCKQTLPKIKCQTFIIHGEKDALAVLEQSKYLKQNIVDSKLYIFENGKHNPNQKYPEKFNKLITDFLLGE
ncbi:Valacyclovir hydrolase [Ooceraea biroi]|uniref:Valacyclovir hydrolase n=1 Tax=Ooceraea biroi TaxID=2015173 RepID=A0A026WN17_OOCBI|nr:Valacyclovir hydrolase [Ooceraea biroi]